MGVRVRAFVRRHARGVASSPRVIVDPEVAEALRAGRGVVALESTIIAHGLPRARQPRASRARSRPPCAASRRGPRDDRGRRRRRCGSASTTTRSRRSPSATTSSRRASATSRRPRRAGVDAATTVASTAHLAARAGIGVFATGGLGGVHRGARETWDESADLTTLARTRHRRRVRRGEVDPRRRRDARAPRDPGRRPSSATGPTRFPGFYLSRLRPPVPLAGRVAASEVAAVLRARAATSVSATARSSSPTRCPADEQLDPALHDRVLRESLAAAAAAGVARQRRHAVPARPLPRETGGASLARTSPRAAQRRARGRRSRRRAAGA